MITVVEGVTKSVIEPVDESISSDYWVNKNLTFKSRKLVFFQFVD